MKMQKKEVGDGVAYARKEDYEYEGTQYKADILNGDKVTILDAGVIEEHPTFGEQHKFIISTKNGNKRASFNQSSINILIDAYGDDSLEWINKEATVLTKKTVIANKKVIVAYFVAEGWSLDDYGDLVNGDESSQELSGEDKEKIKELRDQHNQDVAGDSINPDDIPF